MLLRVLSLFIRLAGRLRSIVFPGTTYPEAHSMGAAIEPNEEKFRELLLYICEKCAFDRYFGATKLNKYLFFADFRAYHQWGKPITGVEYQRLPNGPAPRCLVPIRRALVKEHALKHDDAEPGSKTEARSVALRSPRLDLFTAEEIALVDQIIDRYRNYSATRLSSVSHKHDGWRLANDLETIPYSSALLPHGNDEIPEQVLSHGRRLVAELGKASA
jgi:hypothetical protein